MGLVFNRPTFIIVHEEKYRGSDILLPFQHPLVKKILWVKDYDEKTVEIAAEEISKFVEEQKEYWQNPLKRIL